MHSRKWSSPSRDLRAENVHISITSRQKKNSKIKLADFGQYRSERKRADLFHYDERGSLY